MKKNIITLVAISLSLSGCGIYTKYKPATIVPDHLYGNFSPILICNPSSKWDYRLIPTISPPSFVWNRHRRH